MGKLLLLFLHCITVFLMWFGTNRVAGHLSVSMTILESAVEQGAVCLDGSPPAYHFHRGSGSGINSWIVFLEGGAWCDTISDCQSRALAPLGSSRHMATTEQGKKPFSGILSVDPLLNPDFYNWNLVLVRYCDGASFTGDTFDPATGLHFRGARIFKAMMMELIYKKGMLFSHNAILAGTSAGGLATILNCDKFKSFLPLTIRVKCIASSGYFINAKTITGESYTEELFRRVVNLHGSAKQLPISCTYLAVDPTLCFFPQYAARHIITPLFIVNSAYDEYQINNTLVLKDPTWENCKVDINNCSTNQLQILDDFRLIFLKALNELGPSFTRAYFITSFHTHTGITVTSYWNQNPTLNNKTVAEAVRDWFFYGILFREVDCPYPCGN